MPTVQELKAMMENLSLRVSKGMRKSDMEAAIAEHEAKNNGGKTLYDRLGGVFAIAAVVKRFSDQVLLNPKVGIDSPNPALREWSRNKAATRLDGLVFLRTLWLCDVAGGPQKFVGTKPGSTPLGLENAHCPLRITPDEFDEVAKELSLALDFYHVPPTEKGQVLAAFAAHKPEVVAGAVDPKFAHCPFSGV